MAIKTFIPDSEPTWTPFNAQKESSGAGKKKKQGVGEAVTMADTIAGMSQKNARMWQIIALVSLSSFFISLGILIYAVTLPKTLPVIVTVDYKGNASYVGKVDKAYWGYSKIPEQHKTSQIKKFITNMHTWVIDRNAQRNYMDVATSLCQETASTQLKTFFLNNNPYDWIGIKTKSVELQEPLKQTENTYVIYFDVITYANGYLEKKEKFSALLTLDVFEVTEETKDENPLGLYITSFDIKPVN